jgi:lipid-A-disaccharide synthase-like uncharacterized protein
MILDKIPMSWLVVGFGGQAMFSCRFLIQWLASERRKTSVVPRAFWWFSLVGGLFLLSYAIHRGDIVFIIGQGAGLFIYARNLVLLRRQKSAVSAAP